MKSTQSDKSSKFIIFESSSRMSVYLRFKLIILLLFVVFFTNHTILGQKNDGTYSGTISGTISESFNKDPDDPSSEDFKATKILKEINFKVSGEFLKGDLKGEWQYSSNTKNIKKDWNTYFTCDLKPTGEFICDDAKADTTSIILTGTVSGGIIAGTWKTKQGRAMPIASGKFNATIANQQQDAKITVTKFSEDGIHHPLEFQISVTRDNKPLANAPVTFDITGNYKSLKDDFLVLESAQWIPKKRDKIFGITSNNAIKTDANGLINLRFFADFWRIRNISGASFPFEIQLTAYYTPEDEDKKISGNTSLIVNHAAYARAVFFQLGSVTYPNEVTREKVVQRFAWSNAATDLACESWKFYDRITLNGKTFNPPNTDPEYWMPLENGTILKLDYTQRPSINRDFDSNDSKWGVGCRPEKQWSPLLGSGIALKIEWIDGTQGQFSIHNDNNSNNSVVAIRLPNSASFMQGQKTERLAYFAMAQAKEEVVEFTAKNTLLAYASLAGPEGTAAVGIGWVLYELYDKTSDVVQLLQIATSDGVNYEGGGTFIQLKSKIHQYPNPKGGMTLYTFEGSPSVFDKNGKPVTAKAGQAIDFKVGGEVSQPVFREPNVSAQSALQLIERKNITPKQNTSAVNPPTTIKPVPPLIEKELFFNGNDYGVGNGGQIPTFNLPNASKITFIMTYHWNSGRGATAGTITLIGEDGKQFGPWQVTINNKVYWEVRPNIILPAGRYKVIDSDPTTWAQNSGSGGYGMVRIRGYEIR